MGIFQLMNDDHYAWLWEIQLKSGSKSQLNSLLDSIIKLIDHLVRTYIFPQDWFVMRMRTNFTILSAMKQIAHPLVNHYLRDGMFDNQVIILTFVKNM